MSTRGGVPAPVRGVVSDRASTVLRVSTIEHPDEARAIWSSWDDLAIMRGRPYCSPAWMMSWWEHVAPPDARLRITAVFEGATLVGVAPFFADHGFGGVRRLRLLSAGTSAPLDVLARPGREAEVGGAIARELAMCDPRPDVVMLEGIAADVQWAEVLREAWPGRRTLRIVRQFSQPAPCVELHGSTYQQWFEAKSSDARRKLRQELKAMRKHGATVRFSRDHGELSRDLASFAELHRARWRKRGGSGVLDERVEGMLTDVGRRAVAEGRLRLWSLEVEGRTISAHLFVVAGGETAYWLGGFDERETRIRRPGMMTVLAALEHAFSVGDSRLDLGPGGQPYKYEFARSERAVDWTLLIPAGHRSLLARGQLARLRTRIALAQRLSPRVKWFVRRALEWRPAWWPRR